MRVVTITRHVYKLEELDAYARENAVPYVEGYLCQEEAERIDNDLRNFRRAVEEYSVHSLVAKCDMGVICDDTYCDYADEFKLVYSKLIPELQDGAYAADDVCRAFHKFIIECAGKTLYTDERLNRCANKHGLEFFEDGSLYI